MSSGTLFTRIPAWLRQALATQEPDVPNVLGAIIDPVLDVGQGGWGTMDWAAVVQDSVGTLDTVDVRPANDNLGYLVFAEVLMILAGGTAGTVRLMMRDGVINEDVGLARVTGATTPGFYEHTDLARSPYPFVIPPGFGFRISVDANDNVANAISVQMAIATFRAGFKPI